MIRVEVQIEIKHPAKDTFAFISHFENNPIWQKGMDSCIIIGDPNLQVGQQYGQKASFLGKEVLSTFEVIAYEPGKMVKATSIQGSFPITFTRIVEGDEKISQVYATIEGDASGFFRLAKPLMQIMVNNSIQKDYKRLKHYLESKG